MGIYVEVLMHAPMESLWAHTQEPSLHERWDLRFSTIEYLPRPDPSEPQRFLYATRIGFGMQVAGEGESLGERNLPGDSRVSSLKFSSDDFRSLIREGSGYWKYIPTPEGIRFLTWYDYRTRFGLFGKLFDRAVFRPMIGWATAWSFDRLRLWLERGVPPAVALRQAVTHTFARIAMAFVFAYHGLVPKLLRRDPDELAMLRDLGTPTAWAPTALTLAGLAELLLAIVLVLDHRRRWPVVAVLFVMAAATATVAIGSPRYLGAAFNPVSLNMCVAALAAIDLLNLGDLPSASNCRRTPPPGES